ncbi:uncharacterized protein LOC119450613 isoform X10 [Dermacentor silvarum]|uniref:uncharacterized protein LOC119450613 isoform X10 n=1 Tax=Dermacentor silvarum TaxID=543639 RepID=UPI002100CBD3|nr:uncharacterized protein LOC119450613 isoform X10 [Dermacentor silvarum]
MHSLLMVLGSCVFLVFFSVQGDAAEGPSTTEQVLPKNTTDGPSAAGSAGTRVLPQGPSTTEQVLPKNTTDGPSAAGSAGARVLPQGPSTVEQVRPKNTTDGPGATRLAGKRAPQKAAVTAVNITQKAQAFIDVMNRTWHDISSWGMTSQYSFWTGKHNLHRERPISAHAGVFECDNEMSDDFDDDVKMAVFAWYIPQKICSPVPIYVNVTVAEVSNGELVEKNMALNFNDRNIIKRKTPPKKRRRRTKGLKKIVEMCKFTVNVTFHGWFAYETDNEVTGSRYYSVGIGVLQDKANGLIRRKHNVLSYTIKGLFQRTVFLKKS